MSDALQVKSGSLRIGDRTPDFEARTTHGPVKLSDYRGRWLIFFSHPADFTPVCTTEFVALARHQDKFEAMGLRTARPFCRQSLRPSRLGSCH
jgi:peroxiredoxin (alkyl hydroperoxide reductase subunit C)